MKQKYHAIALGVLWKIFVGMLILLYSIVISSTLLGVLKIFHFGTVIFLSITFSIVLYVLWGKEQFKESPESPENDLDPDQTRNFNIINGVGFGLSALLLILLVVPILNWPMSFMEKRIIWDAGLYHFPKAVEMWATGSAWDFSISYGDYPFGYESILSFILFFTKDIGQFSYVHLVIILLFILSAWFLAIKYSKLPPGILLLGVIFLILSGFLPVDNPWYFVHYLPYTIGKNDLFLAGVLLSAIVFVPLHKGKKKRIDWIGLGLTSGLAISLKPNAVPILLFLWVYAFFSMIKKDLPRKTFFLGVVLASMGGSWIIRNLIGINKLFIPESYRILDRSIWSNLDNPDFYLNIPTVLIFSFVLALGFLIFAFLNKSKLSKTDAGLYIFSLLVFIITPAAVAPDDPSALGWRFGLTMLMLQYVYLVAAFDLPAMFLLTRVMKSNSATYLVSGLAVILIGGFFYSQIHILPRVPEYGTMLERPYTVYEYEYPSVFDYVDQNIHDSVVWIEGAQHYYAYDPDFTNTITRSRDADYIIVLAKSLDKYWFEVSDWDIIYQDSRGFVLEKRTD